ncbi:hypothetical protein [Xanthomonas arboricola]|uniref:hypothetical protein n=1 Tax=Xanthomonas arboricola TaxID=56448 RepID=UPI000F8F298F|nr:hypothetical protein [Xanthomonas arboricola]
MNEIEKRLGQQADLPYLVQPAACRYTPAEVGRMLGNRVIQPHYAEWLVRKAIEQALSQRTDGRIYHEALQQIGGALGLPAGSDLTTQCIPAIEAMRRDADRWQFVRAGSPVTIRLDGRLQPHGITGLVPHYFNGRDERELDASIDAAIQYAAKSDRGADCDQAGCLNSRLGKTMADAVQRYDQMPDWMKNIVAKPESQA